jgi:hypothetical protein
MRIACWIRSTKNTHSEYVILTAFPLRQWLHERASMLRYTYIASLVMITIVIAMSKLTSIMLFPERRNAYYHVITCKATTITIFRKID